MTLTISRLTELLRYEPETGIFTRVKCRPGFSAGGIAGSPDKNGYICIEIDGKKYKAHRLAWFYMTGEWPINSIDHINAKKDDNRFSNLRDCSMRVNRENQISARSDNKLGVLGVSTSKDGKKFIAQIQVKGSKITLGRFDSADAASDAYREAKKELHEGSTL